MQDHRAYPAHLPAELLNVTFNELRPDPRLRIFQFHMGIGRDFAVNQDTHIFDTVELSYDDDRGGDGGGGGGDALPEPTRVKLAAQSCIGLMPSGTPGRVKRNKAAKFGDYVGRCAFLMDDALALRLSDRRHRANASFEVHACNDVARFPLAEVLHFPEAAPITERGLLPRPSHGFPSAPWFVAGCPQQELPVKYTWASDDNLWLLWMLDVVGVDHVVMNIVTGDLKMSMVRESIAQHKGLAERVTLVDLAFPRRKTNHSQSFLLQAQAHELFLRWQADFDYIFLLDPDEFPQLFNATATDTTTAQPRIDIKTFISLNREQIKEQGHAYFTRPFVLRSAPNSEADPLLAALLSELAPLDGLATSAVWADKIRPAEELGKALFPVAAALRPYLHYNDYWPGRSMYDWRTGHVLHVREPLKNTPAPSAPGVQWFLDEFARGEKQNV
ncbi:uncharacterized protein ACA1_096530 [Acanthamoeba castellanii str. Neff]|uniref:Glycosyltransferase family 92 protein n=1 Tax=Acanthamoeba castellanii (strain ATCC 30010 / Neff) TaxID=1257118 RepID=L8GIZ5_ACACF|nr:uncharacterized protein ACA1_096530 [Acanthamoeba castellanii str. Neff]ELR12982.1 hypothetical protein ACA1_096530 [Acanthamoeba castellanii str. Neff]